MTTDPALHVWALDSLSDTSTVWFGLLHLRCQRCGIWLQKGMDLRCRPPRAKGLSELARTEALP